MANRLKGQMHAFPAHQLGGSRYSKRTDRELCQILPGLLILLLVLSLGTATGSDNRIKILAACRAGTRISVVRGWFLTEPTLTGTVVPSRTTDATATEEVQKTIRIYFPRSFEELEGYGFILLGCVDMDFFTVKQATWMYEAITGSGLGGMNTRSVHSMSTAWSGPWMNSILSDAFPNDVPAVVNSAHYRAETFAIGSLAVNDREGIPQIVLPFRESIEGRIQVEGVLTIPRQGSTVYTWVRSTLMDSGERAGYIAHLFSWSYQNGTTFTAMDRIMEDFWTNRGNPYSVDIVSNLIWYSAGRDLPQDPYEVHALRELFRLYVFIKPSLVSMFDFAENFGANARGIYSELETIEEMKIEADQDYLEGEFESSYEKMKALLGDLKRLEVDAVKLKNSALAWVFLIEWLSVSSTMLVCSVLIWQLMVRRRVYREVGVTRLRLTGDS
jgi:hypothetical protein